MLELLDLFCGRGGWSRPAIAKGWHAVGFDIFDYGYPGQLCIDRLPVPLSYLQAFDPDLVVASPPCEAYARACLPWINEPSGVTSALELLNWSIGLIGQFNCPVIVECSRFAARFSSTPPTTQVGPYSLWGDVPALLPQITHHKTHLSGSDPAARAMIDTALAEWIAAQVEARHA